METTNQDLAPVRSAFRGSRGLVLGTVAAVLIIVALGLFVAARSISSCMTGDVEVDCPAPLLGPEGGQVRDKFYFVHQPLAADGSITARVTSMDGIITYPPPDHDAIVPGLVPWAKAGLIAKDGTTQGSRYVAVMVTAEHGVRMQHDFVHDTAGRPGAVPRWLRLARSGDTVTGAESADGVSWTTVGTATLTGAVEIGLFVTSPSDVTVSGGTAAARLSKTTATFDSVALTGNVPGGDWIQDDVGLGLNPDGEPHHPGSALRDGEVFTVSGNGDIGPLAGESGMGVQLALIGLPTGLIVMIVVAALFASATPRSPADPRRVLGARAVVAAGVMFVAGVVAAATTVPLAWAVLRHNGSPQPGLPVAEIARVSVQTGLLLAGVALLAMGLGALLRRGLIAAGVTVAVVVLPYLVALFGVLPAAASDWVLRLTPAAAFAFQQIEPEYAHVEAYYAPLTGFYPLPGWAGLAVLAAWSTLALGLGALRLRSRGLPDPAGGSR